MPQARGNLAWSSLKYLCLFSEFSEYVAARYVTLLLRKRDILQEIFVTMKIQKQYYSFSNVI